jgi:TatA/E family protein of Tat protein translocase
LGNIGSTELIVIFVLALLLLGPRRLPEVGEALGRTLRRFRQASRELRDEIDVRRDVDIRRDLDAMDKSEKPAAPRDTQSRGALGSNEKIAVADSGPAKVVESASEMSPPTETTRSPQPPANPVPSAASHGSDEDPAGSPTPEGPDPASR